MDYSRHLIIQEIKAYMNQASDRFQRWKIMYVYKMWSEAMALSLANHRCQKYMGFKKLLNKSMNKTSSKIYLVRKKKPSPPPKTPTISISQTV